MAVLFFFFFFSSRRRHTRLQGDWSSDVCSSDLRELTLGHASLQIFALVVQLLGFGERDHHLGDPVLEVQLERHERQSLAARAADQLADLVRVEQQLAGAGGRRIVVAAWKVRGGGQGPEPHPTLAHMRVRFAETRLAAPQRLDLRASMYEPGVPSFEEMDVVTST